MGSFMSSAYATPEEEDSGPVLAVHSKATWDERLEDNRRSASKLVRPDAARPRFSSSAPLSSGSDQVRHGWFSACSFAGLST